MEAKDILKIANMLSDLGPAIKNMPTESTLLKLIDIAPMMKTMPTDETLRGLQDLAPMLSKLPSEQTLKEISSVMREAMPFIKRVEALVAGIPAESLTSAPAAIRTLGELLAQFSPEEVKKLADGLKGMVELALIMREDGPPMKPAKVLEGVATPVA